MNKGKMIGYYGSGKPKYENDEVNYNQGGYSPSYNPNPFNRVDFARKNSDTYYKNNGVHRRYW